VPPRGYVGTTLEREAWEALKRLSKEWKTDLSETILRLIERSRVEERLEAIEARLKAIEEKLDKLLTLQQR